MAEDRIDEAQIERDLETIERIRSIAWQRRPVNLSALLDRLRVKLLVEDLPRGQRRVYRAVIDYFEDVLEDRLEKEGDADRSALRGRTAGYLRDLLKSLNDER